MANIKDYINKIQDGTVSLEEQQKALSEIEKTIIEQKQKRDEAIGKNVDMVVSALRTIEDKLNAKYQELLNTPAMVGEQGPQGPAGKDGKDGKDGVVGRDGKDGIDGQDGKDGKDGVSVVDAQIDFDGSLVIKLSDGSEIDAGQVLPLDTAKLVHAVSTNGGGTSQSVLDALADLQAQIDGLSGASIPSQTGNAGKFLTTNGSVTSWATVSGGTGAVDSVNGQTGTVVLTASSVGAEPADATILKSANIGVSVQAYDADLSAIGAIAGTSGLLKKTAANTWSLDTNTYLTSYTETDPIYTASSWYTTTNNATNWNTAYGWGNHASAGYLTSSAIGTTVQAYDADLTSWAAITPSSKQDALVSGTNIKTINGSSILGSGDLTISGGSGSPGGSNTQVQYNASGSFAGDANFTWDGTTLKATNLETTAGVLADGSFSGTYVDGIVMDYTTGAGRISVGGADSLNFYNGGVAGSLLGSVANNGDWSITRFLDIGPGALIGGATNPVFASSASANNYVQAYIRNDQNGVSSSADFVAYPNNGADTSGWVDIGITSLAYADTTYTVTGPNEGYLFTSAPSGSSTSGNLVYATDSTGTSNAHQWYVGGFTQSKSAYKMQLNGTNLLVKQPIQANGVIESTTGGFKFPDATTQTTAATPFTGGTLTSSLNLAAGTTSVAPIDFATGTLMTTAQAGAMEFDGTAFYSSTASATRGVIPSEQFVVLNANYTLTSQTAAQKIFNASTNGSITLPIGTYQYELSFSLTGMSATSGSFGFALGGAATKTYTYHSTSSKAGTSLTTGQATLQTFGSAANTALQTASTGTVGTALIKGIIRVTVAGTVIPQVSLTIAAAAIVQSGSYFKVSPIGSSTVTTVGNWS